jgi:putative Mg2+ transporter-C (MgtC) family protein
MPEQGADVIRSLRLELLLQLALAVLAGGAIGLERELKGKPAGLRTNILICLGATLFAVLSVHVAGSRGDPGRVTAQILPGVGFIGAGTILHMRGHVTGLTSAATIWIVAAIGMALGTRAYTEALGSTALVIVVLVGVERLEDLVARHFTRTRLVIHARPERDTIEQLEDLVRITGLKLDEVVSRRENVDLVAELTLSGPKRLHDEVLIALVHHPLVRGVSRGE